MTPGGSLTSLSPTVPQQTLTFEQSIVNEILLPSETTCSVIQLSSMLRSFQPGPHSQSCVTHFHSLDFFFFSPPQQAGRHDSTDGTASSVSRTDVGADVSAEWTPTASYSLQHWRPPPRRTSRRMARKCSRKQTPV